jgi:hypothetical protein
VVRVGLKVGDHVSPVLVGPIEGADVLFVGLVVGTREGAFVNSDHGIL